MTPAEYAATLVGVLLLLLVVVRVALEVLFYCVIKSLDFTHNDDFKKR